MRGPFLGVLFMRIITYCGQFLGPPGLGNHQIAQSKSDDCILDPKVGIICG